MGLVTALGGQAARAADPAPASTPAPATPPAPAAPLRLPGEGRNMPDSFADLAARLLPAVVNVSTTEMVRPGEDDDDGDDGDSTPQVPNFPEGSPFEKFFHDFMNRQDSPNAPPRKMQALGSGFIIDPSGVVVTNKPRRAPCRPDHHHAAG
ncbi:hypothetical protein AA15237_3142 [Komagataeibacter xylinus NBRC 15237]|nr:hypothetical protein AA15237_3142 [Komagataeibacter xylinus NBRC 15237]